MRTVTFGTSVAGLAAAAGLVAALAAGTTSASASTGPASTGPARTGSAATPARWSRVTPNGTLNIADIGLAITGKGVLNVIWANGISSAGHVAIEDTPVSPAGVVGRAHGRQMDRGQRRAWRSDLAKNRKSSLEAPSWLWASVVELIALHEAAYLDHCRQYALSNAA